MTSITNSWSGIYRILAGRDKRAARQTTLKQKDYTLTTNLQETIQHILRIHIPEANQEDDTELQKNIRALAQEDIDTDDDKEFTYRKLRTWYWAWEKIRHQGRTEYQVKSLRVW